MHHRLLVLSFFFFNDTATTEIYTLSLHDALPICMKCNDPNIACNASQRRLVAVGGDEHISCRCQLKPLSRSDRKSTRLNSSHLVISYAVFCLKKKRILTGRYPISPGHADN